MGRLFIKKRNREPVVTHDSHASGASRHNGRRAPRPDLGRPSLFADFDQESVEDVEPERIRLLSTLESQRGARGRPRTRRMPAGSTHPWLTRALMATMALGMLVMLLSFIQLLRRPPPLAQPLQAHAATPSASGATSPLAPATNEAPADAAEIIDIAPPAAAPASLPQPALADAAPATINDRTAPLTTALRASASLAQPSKPDQAARSERPNTQQPSAKRQANAPSDDVALLEAMLAHAGPRKATAQPTKALQQCGTGSSPETAVCRARVCVQNPSLPACHTP